MGAWLEGYPVRLRSPEVSLPRCMQLQAAELAHLPMLGSPEIFWGLGDGLALLLGFCPLDEPLDGK